MGIPEVSICILILKVYEGLTSCLLKALHKIVSSVDVSYLAFVATTAKFYPVLTSNWLIKNTTVWRMTTKFPAKTNLAVCSDRHLQMKFVIMWVLNCYSEIQG